jgi:hypothetical protein
MRVRKNGIGAVAVAAPEVIAVHPMLGRHIPMTGSTAARRFISRRLGRVTRRIWPVIQTRNRCFLSWPR